MEWISVKDRLPENGVEVLITQFEYFDPKKDRYYLVGFRKHNLWFEVLTDCDGMETTLPPTHWMPLPAPPTLTENPDHTEDD